MDPADVERELRGLAQRVRALEERLNLPAVAPVVSMPGAAAPAAQAGPELLPTIGRSLLALAGGYFLRALVESGAFPPGPGAAIGIFYAVAWLVWAARTPAERRIEAAAHALTSVLVLAPLLWESTLRFQALSPWSAALTLLAFTILGLAISWRKNLLIVATISTIAGLVTAAALLVGTHNVLPFTFFFLATAAAVEVSACLDHWLSERWLAAAAADLSVVLATWLVTNSRGLPEAYAPIPAGWLAAAQVALLAMYLVSTIVRTLLRHLPVTVFEMLQCVAAFGIVLAGGLPLSPAMLVCGVACYLVAFLVLERGGGRNFYTYSTFAILLVVAGSRMALAGPMAAGVWAALAIGCVWSRRLTLQVHGAIYLSLAFAAYGPLSRGPAGIVLAAACYLGVRWTPLRIFLFAGIAWTVANFAASVAPASLQLALKLVIYGAALIVLPRLRASRAAGSADSETTPRPRDSAAKSDTASGAA